MSNPSWVRPIPLMVFLVGGLLVSMTRGDASNMVVQVAQGLPNAGDACLECHRNTAWLYHGVRLALMTLSQLLFLGADAGPFAVSTPWAYVDSASHNNTAVLLMAYYGHELILVLPVYFLSKMMLSDDRVRIIYIISIIAVLGGWPATLINIVFNIGIFFVDWPPSYYLFPHQILTFDWASIGFVHLLAIALLLKHDFRWWAAPLYAAFGQVMMDNLGMVAGVCFFLAALSRHHYRTAFVQLALCAVASAVVLLIFSLFGRMQTEHQGMALAAQQSGIAAGAQAWLGYYWDNIGKYNFLWLNVTIANFISVCFWPVVVGFILGAITCQKSNIPNTHMLRAIMLPAIGFMVTLFLAMFKSGLGSDMGRQALPLLSLLLPLAWIGGASLRRR